MKKYFIFIPNLLTIVRIALVYPILNNIYLGNFEISIIYFVVASVTDGLDGFILWDRETESLWWPLIDKAVSGPLKGVGLQKLEAIHWEDTTWRNIKQNYPDAKIMKSGLDYKRPKSWKKYNDVSDIVKTYSNR